MASSCPARPLHCHRRGISLSRGDISAICCHFWHRHCICAPHEEALRRQRIKTGAVESSDAGGAINNALVASVVAAETKRAMRRCEPSSRLGSREGVAAISLLPWRGCHEVTGNVFLASALLHLQSAACLSMKRKAPSHEVIYHRAWQCRQSLLNITRRGVRKSA